MSQDHSALIPVPFHGATLTLIDHNGEPFAAMRPIVEAMGMAWQGQTDKIKTRYTSTVMEIMTVAEDGKQRAMTCLPAQAQRLADDDPPQQGPRRSARAHHRLPG